MKLGLILNLIMIVIAMGCTSSSTTGQVTGQLDNSPQVRTFTDNDFYLVISNPTDYKGYLVDISGQIFTSPEVVGDNIGFQMYQGGKFDLNRNVAVGYRDNLEFQLKSQDCVRILGSIEGEYKGENAFGATIKVVTVTASYIEKIECKDVIYPTKKIIQLGESQTKNKVTVYLDKIEFADEHTRVYLKVKNDGTDKIYFNDYNSLAFQDNKQFKTTIVFDANYPSIDNDIYPSIEENGIIVFEPLDYTNPNIKLQFEMTSSSFLDTTKFIFYSGQKPSEQENTMNVEFEIFEIESNYYEFSGEGNGYIQSVSYRLKNTGTESIKPTFKIKISYAPSGRVIFEGKQNTYSEISPGDIEVDKLTLFQNVKQKGFYLIEIDVYQDDLEIASFGKNFEVA